MTTKPNGSIALTVAQVTGHIDFESFQPVDFAFGPLYVEHLTAANPLAIRIVPGARTIAGGYVTGVDFTLVPAPDATGYVLRWGIA